MSSIKLKHASGNSMSLSAPATNPASDLELKLPATIGTAGQVLKNSSTAGTLEFGDDSAGKLLQVVTATNTTNVTVTSSTFTTFITADITPTAQNSKYIVVVTTGLYMSETASRTQVGCGWTLSRSIGGGSIHGLVGDPQDTNGPYGHYMQIAADQQIGVISTKIGYDSPDSTSTLTYYAEGRPYWPSGNQVIFGQTSDSQIVIYEVAG